MRATDRDVRLVPMTQAEFDTWAPHSVRGFAAQQVAAGRAREPEATAYAERTFARLLPAGRDTPGHHLWSVRTEDPEPVGHLWLCVRARPQGGTEGYVYDVELLARVRGRGLGRVVMLAAERAARMHGASHMRLSVFGHNEAARGLYASLDYAVVAASRTPPHEGSRLIAAMLEKPLG